MRTLTLKMMAEDGYVMGLPTIGEVATHMDLHYDLYFSIDNFAAEMAAFEALIDGHTEESIFKYLSEEDKARMDDELEKALAESPAPESFDDIG